MSKGGRPRKVRSEPTSGVGGRLFSDEEKKQLLEIGEQYGLDRDDHLACKAYLEALWFTYGSYCATEQALAKQVSIADELFDLQTLLNRSRAVLAMISNKDDLVDAERCVAAAGELSSSLHAFPGLVDAKISAMPERPTFLEARDKLRVNVYRVRLWNLHRSEFIHCLEVLIDVCERVEPPERFTKRTRQSRDMFQTELGELYLELLHPMRHANWRETLREPNDPPPPQSTDKFAHEVMNALGVRFESKGVSG